MNRNSLGEVSGRSMHQFVRLTLKQAIDDPMMQEMMFDGMNSDGRSKPAERMQSYGMSSTPLGPDQSEGGQSSSGGSGKSASARAGGGGGGGGGGGEGGQGGGAAEGIAVYPGGQRNHPVIIGVDDRRHRPMGLKPGENAQYDDIQQMTLMRRNGLYLLSNDNPEKEGGQSTERMVSLRHVEKKKQERGEIGKGDKSLMLAKMTPEARRRYQLQALAKEQERQQKNRNHKHEGEQVNTEVRVTKKKIEFRNGDEVVGEHDKQSKKWNMKGKEFNANPDDAVNMKSKKIDMNGSDGINMDGPISMNGSPMPSPAVLVTQDQLQALVTRIAQLEARLGL